MTQQPGQPKKKSSLWIVILVIIAIIVLANRSGFGNGSWQCHYCGHRNIASARECSQCEYPWDGIWECRACGKYNGNYSQICERCGHWQAD